MGVAARADGGHCTLLATPVCLPTEVSRVAWSSIFLGELGRHGGPVGRLCDYSQRMGPRQSFLGREDSSRDP